MQLQQPRPPPPYLSTITCWMEYEMLYGRGCDNTYCNACGEQQSIDSLHWPPYYKGCKQKVEYVIYIYKPLDLLICTSSQASLSFNTFASAFIVFFDRAGDTRSELSRDQPLPFKPYLHSSNGFPQDSTAGCCRWRVIKIFKSDLLTKYVIMFTSCCVNQFALLLLQSTTNLCDKHVAFLVSALPYKPPTC